MMREKDAAIISIGAGISQLPLIRAARRLGWQVVAVDRDPEAPGFPEADLAIRESTHDADAVLAALAAVREHFHLSGVVARTTAAAALHTGMTLSREFGLPGLTPELLEIATQKAKFREFCLEHGLPAPFGRQVEPSDEPAELPPLPLIIKPDMTVAGKAGIRVCRSRETLAACVAEAARASANGRVEVAAFIAGLDATCLCWAAYGEARIITWWDELVALDQHDGLVGLGVSLPALLAGTPTLARAEDLVRRLVGHFPAAEALLLISCRFSPEGQPYFIEVHADLGGDAIAEVLWPAARTSIDFFELAVQVAAGVLDKTPTFSCRPTALYYDAQDLDFPGKILMDPGLQDLVVQQDNIQGNLALARDIIQARHLHLQEGPGHLAKLALGEART